MGYGRGNKDIQAIRIAAALAYISICEMDRISIYIIHNNRVEELASMLGKEAFLNNINKLNDITFEGEVDISEAIRSSTVGYGDGLSVIISDFLTDNDYLAALDHLVGKKRDVLCVQVLSAEELNTKARGKVHYYDSESSAKFYRRNINKDIVQAYAQALEYVTGNLRNACHSRGAQYALVSADDTLFQVFFEKFMTSGVIK